MPVESVAAYNNNTITFVMFILVSIIVFFILFLISSGLRRRAVNRNPQLSYRETDEPGGGKSFTGIDPFKKRNTALLGMAFALALLCVILILASFYFSFNTGMGLMVFIIAFIILAIITVLIYIFGSGVFNK
jgi:hypothetical protein